jgi:hypothetical protein
VNDDAELLIESLTSAWRDRDADGRAVPPPAWWDLSPEERELAFDAQAATRELERAMDSEGFSGTVRGVLERLLRMG